MTIGSFGMVEESQSWTRIIDVAVTKANVGYIAEGADPDAHGVAAANGFYDGSGGEAIGGAYYQRADGALFDGDGGVVGN